jgi:hypothetical protein
MSSLVAGRHCSTAQSRRKWFATRLRISISSDTNGRKRCGCEVAIAEEKDCCAKAEVAKNLEKKWWQRKESSGS